MITRGLFMLLAVLFAGPALAAALLQETFEDGNADGWAPMGDGDVRLTNYLGNTSMRLQKQAAALRAVPLGDAGRLRISINMAALGLESGEACLGEVSLDGKSWQAVLRVEDGQDDGVTLHTGRLALSVPEGAETLYIGLRVQGSRDDDQCWADNINVTGTPASAPVQSGRLPAGLLAGAVDFATPYEMAAFAPPEKTTPPQVAFEGRVSVSDAVAGGGSTLLHDGFNLSGPKALPSFAVDLVQDGDVLIPLQRGPMIGGDWEMVVAPGRVWSEAGENRAGLPFALVERNANCTHNGVLSFAYTAAGEISQVAYQIASETCAYLQFDLWGRTQARYQPGPVPTKSETVAAYQQERAARLPSKPISALAEDFPGARSEKLGSEIPADEMTTFGAVVDGVHYTAGCDTRFGAYPYCDHLILPSYSLAKSLFGGLALMRMEALYPGAKDAKIVDYVPACARAGSWDDVTFEHALDMTTGHYRDTGYEVDESSAAVSQNFFIPERHQQRIKFACTHFPRKEKPGKRTVYHTTDTYILGTAMAAYLRAQQPGADIYRDVLHADIWAPLNLSPLLDETRRSYDDAAQPFAGWGLFLHASDLARIAEFLQRGSDVFDRQMLAAALQQDPEDRGLRSNDPNFRYQNGFWAWQAGDYLGCAAPVWLPFMSGFGGLTVALLPNGASYYYVSDGYSFAWGQSVAEINRLRPFCQTKAAS